MHYFYGFKHRYGMSVGDNLGNDIGTCVRFTSKADRDAWVSNGPRYTTDHGYREAYPAWKAQAWGDRILDAAEVLA